MSEYQNFEPETDDNAPRSEETNDEAFFIEEPPIEPDDTRPRAPVQPEDDAEAADQPPEMAEDLTPPSFVDEVFDALAAEEPPYDPQADTASNAPPSFVDAVADSLAAEEPPYDPQADTADIAASLATPARGLLLGIVMVGTLCMCMALVSFAGFAGYRDGLATNDVKITQTLATGIAEQYATGVADLEQGYAELAAARFGWIVETVQPGPEYALDSPQLLATARAISSYTPTPVPTLTETPTPSSTPTLSPTLEPTLSPTPTLNPLQDPAYLYDQAATAMSVVHYEDAIAWLDALRALAPNYRAEEAKAMLMEALTQQGRIYLRGQNKDGEDMMARGGLLIYRANELGPVEPSELLGEAIFVESYINARNYVAGGQYAAALPILEDLCSMNCSWGYPNVDPVTVRDLLNQAQQGAP
jgi:cell division septation protein DedD